MPPLSAKNATLPQTGGSAADVLLQQQLADETEAQRKKRLLEEAARRSTGQGATSAANDLLGNPGGMT